MAKDMVLIIAIFCFYFFFSTMTTFVLQDESLIAIGLTNATFETDLTGNSTMPMHGEEAQIEDHFNLHLLQETDFWSTFSRIVTFRIGSLTYLPEIVIIIINFINFMTLVIGGLLIMRMIRHGGG